MILFSPCILYTSLGMICNKRYFQKVKQYHIFHINIIIKLKGYILNFI